jgi:Carboxypeptidase regulatory-like domain
MTNCAGRSASLRVCLGVLLFTLWQSTALLAQTATGSITGTVTDPSGSALGAAKVTVVNTNTNGSRLTTTNNLGYYSYTLLPPGQYRVTIETQGFKRFVQQNVRLDVGVGLTINATLDIGSTAESVTVDAQPEILESQSSTLSQVINNRIVDNLPLNGRNSYSFAALVPGVIAPGGFTQTAIDEYNDQFVSINGSRPNATVFLLDGGTNTEPSFSGPGVYPSVDLVDQYNVQTNNLSAEFTGTGGGVINVITKSGSNRFHGSAYGYFRTTGLSANNFFSNKAGLARAPFQFKQFGASLGGPIRRDKTFFFFSYEGVRWAEGITTVATVPTAAQRAGDFSQTLNAQGQVIPIFDPFSTRSDPSNPGHSIRDQFPGNIIPTGEINPVSAALLKYFPAPNGPGDPATGTNNFTSNTTSDLTKNDYSLRLDQVFTQNQKLFGRFTTSTTHQPRPSLFGSSADLAIGSPTNGNDILKQLQATVGDTMVLRPNLVLELNSSGVYYSLKRVAPGQGVDPTTIGFPANYDTLTTAYSPCFLAATIAGMVPSSSLGNILSGATIGSFCGFHYRFNNFLEYGNLTLVKGAHIFKIGADAGRSMMWGNGYNNVYPILNFGPNFTEGPDPVNSSDSGSGFASFLAGTGSGNTPSGGPSLLLFHNLYAGLYFQDDWRITRKLTLNLGIRYDYNGPLSQDRLAVANWNFTAASPLQVPGLNLVGGLQFPGKTGLWNSDKGTVEPRFGFAFSALKNTVVRGGISLITAPIDGAGFNQNAMPSPGFQGSTPWVGTLDGVTPLNTLSNPFPSGFVLPTGNSLGLATALGQGVSVMERYRPSSYTEQWNLDLQQLLPGNILFDLAYTGSHGLHLFADTLINQLPDKYLPMGSQLTNQVANPFYGSISTGALSSPTVSASQLLLPYPQFTNVDLANGSTFGASAYNALYLKIERRFANGFSVLGSYTWSKLMDNIPASETGFPGGVYQDETFNGGGGGIQNWYNLKGERSLATYNTTQVLAINGIWELPFGKGKQLFSNDNQVVNYVAGGWQLNGIVSVHSGSPLEVYMASNTLFNNGGTQRANWNGQDPILPGPTVKKLNGYFNLNDFSAPASFTYGNSPRTLGVLTSPGLANVDLSGIKNIPIRDNWKVQFRAEAFNLFNHPQFAPPDTSLGDGTTGVISSQINLPRQIQFAVRLVF